MYYIDPHIHMVSRTTDDYETLAKMGCVGMSEPAFWAGFDRGSVDSFRDYFRQLTDFEKAGRPVRHQALHLAVHQRQRGRERQAFARCDRHDSRVPRSADVLGIGEIGLNKNTRNEATSSWSTSIWPCGTTVDPDPHAPPGRQVPGDDDDSRHALRRQPRSTATACWSITSKSTRCGTCSKTVLGRHDAVSRVEVHAARAADMIEMYGPERLLVNSAGDWGPSRARPPCPTSSSRCAAAATPRA